MIRTAASPAQNTITTRLRTLGCPAYYRSISKSTQTATRHICDPSAPPTLSRMLKASRELGLSRVRIKRHKSNRGARPKGASCEQSRNHHPSVPEPFHHSSTTYLLHLVPSRRHTFKFITTCSCFISSHRSSGYPWCGGEYKHVQK